MDKIPVGRTIGQSYSFAFGRYLPLLGIVWLPVLLIGLFGYFILIPFYQSFPDLIREMALNPHNPRILPPEIYSTVRWIGLLDIVALLIFAMITVGITKEVLGLRQGPRFVYLSFGAAELRVVGSYFILLALLYAAMIAVAIVGGLLGALLYAVASGFVQGDSKSLSGWGVGAIVALAVVVYCAAIYVMVRLSYLNVPVIVAERRIGILRSWELTKGNFWRVFVISLAIFIPFMVLEFAALGIAFGPALIDFIGTVHEAPATAAAKLAMLMTSFLRFLPYMWAVGFLVAPVLYGLLISPAAFAYRALVPAAPEGGTAPTMKEHA
ncbi:MAG: hypothetical protein ABSC92_15660 [Rhizomicrobium sp.]|jgi:hypothetical protein